MAKYIRFLMIFVLFLGIGANLFAQASSKGFLTFPEGDKYIILLTFSKDRVHIADYLSQIHGGTHYMEKTNTYYLYGIETNDKGVAKQIYSYINKIKSGSDRLYLEVYSTLTDEAAAKALKGYEWQLLEGNYYHKDKHRQEYLKQTGQSWHLVRGYPYILSGY